MLTPIIRKRVEAWQAGVEIAYLAAPTDEWSDFEINAAAEIENFFIHRLCRN